VPRKSDRTGGPVKRVRAVAMTEVWSDRVWIDLSGLNVRRDDDGGNARAETKCKVR